MNPHSELPSVDASSFNLDSRQHENRFLLVFALSEQTPAYREQIQQLESQAKGFRDRDLLLVPILTTSRSSPGATSGDAAMASRLRETALEKLRQRLNVGVESFTVILVGKDGTEKFRSHSPIDPIQLFEQIDAMPMRQQEMQQQVG